MKILHHVVRNHSRFSRDVVWKNALDLEHVVTLHGDTNAEFHLLGTHPPGREDYEWMAYHATRRFFIFKIQSFGVRRVISEFNLWQVEYIPFFRMTIALNSLLKTDTKSGTHLIDELVVEGPRILSVLRNFIRRSLERHARIQCEQDESFRARLSQLKEKGIDFPYRLFNTSIMNEVGAQFRETISDPGL